MGVFPEQIDGLPNLCGFEDVLGDELAAAHAEPGALDADAAFEGIDSAFSIALHMHQPLIPAGGCELRSAELVSNLSSMLEHPEIGDNHNAAMFLWCYRRMAEFVPQLLSEGLAPRVMLDYSGTLLWGLRRMGQGDLLDALVHLTTDATSRQAVEWLGCTWGHAVAPSTPVQDFRLHVRAWQHHFAGLFGLETLARVRGFSPAEMALPNHPDVAYQFVKTLSDCGYHYVLVQEHTVEELDGASLREPHLPRQLVCRSSSGEAAAITAIVKTQGSDSKLVGQMQPYYEARGLAAHELGGKRVPQLAVQIADGENGGVMMNEFPPKYFEVVGECSGSRTPMLNVGEYLARIGSLGVRETDLLPIQPLHQARIWEAMAPGDGAERLAAVIGELRSRDDRFQVEGGSWTNDVSWVRGYEQVLAPMDEASALFHERLLGRGVPSDDPGFRRALFYLLVAETSCYRYWGEGIWTDYGKELSRRAIEAIEAVG